MNLKTWITCLSLVLNGVLVGALLLNREPEASREPSSPLRVPESMDEPAHAAFQWQQIEADDFPTFIDNLRRIGCPDSTIQGIVKDELAQVYAARRAEVRRAMGDREAASRAELEKIDAEEAAVLATLMATPDAPADVKKEMADVTATPVSSGTLIPAAFVVGNDPNEAPVTGTDSLPLVPNDSSLDPATSKIIGEMREQFAQSVRAAGAEPASKTYLQSWMNAQRLSDERFSSLFGGDVFVRTQTRAAQEAAAAARAKSE